MACKCASVHQPVREEADSRGFAVDSPDRVRIFGAEPPGIFPTRSGQVDREILVTSD